MFIGIVISDHCAMLFFVLFYGSIVSIYRADCGSPEASIGTQSSVKESALHSIIYIYSMQQGSPILPTIAGCTAIVRSTCDSRQYCDSS